jgi:hypothetical protein
MIKQYHLFFIIYVMFSFCLACKKVNDKTDYYKKIGLVYDSTFNLFLHPSTIVFKNEIEADYGRKIKLAYLYKVDDGYDGDATVLNNGELLLRLNSSTGRNETTVLHELWHFKRTFEGCPAIEWQPYKGIDNRITQELATDFYQFIFDAIVHSTFYPKMREQGFIPDDNQRQRVIKTLVNSNENETFDIIQTPMGYFKSNIELSDTNLLNKLDDYFIHKKWVHVYKIGTSMVDLAKKANINSAEDQIELFVNCLNLLFENNTTFEIEDWDYDLLGYFKRRCVVIGIKPTTTLKVKI